MAWDSDSELGELCQSSDLIFVGFILGFVFRVGSGGAGFAVQGSGFRWIWKDYCDDRSLRTRSEALHAEG